MRILSFIYLLITTIRNFLYDEKILPINRVPNVEVICIGNISVGGTGKTPAVHFFVKKLLARGRKVAVISRGYKGKRKRDPMLVSDGMVIFASSQESGDEPYIHALNFRDRDVVLIDATNPFGYGHVLPWGLLREDFKRAAKRAVEFIITKADLVNERELKRIKNYLKKRFSKDVSVAKHGVSKLCDLKGNMKPLFWLQGKRLLIFSGLANPLNFEKTVISLAPSYIERIDFKDHHNFKPKDIALVRKKAEKMDADYIVTTEKDLVKLPDNLNIPNLYVLKIEFSMLEDNTLN